MIIYPSLLVRAVPNGLHIVNSKDNAISKNRLKNMILCHIQLLFTSSVIFFSRQNLNFYFLGNTDLFNYYVLHFWIFLKASFFLLVSKKSETSDVEESKIGNEESDLGESCMIPHSPVTTDKRSVKSPKVNIKKDGCSKM